MRGTRGRAELDLEKARLALTDEGSRCASSDACWRPGARPHASRRSRGRRTRRPERCASIADSERLARRWPACCVLVVGSGFIGCEAAVSLAMRGAEGDGRDARGGPAGRAARRATSLQRIGGLAGGSRASSCCPRRNWRRSHGVTTRRHDRASKTDASVDGGRRPPGARRRRATTSWPRRPESRSTTASPSTPRWRTCRPAPARAGDVAFAENSAAGRRLRVEHWGEALNHGRGRRQGRWPGVEARWDVAPGLLVDASASARSSTPAGATAGTRFASSRAMVSAFAAWYGRDGELVGVVAHERRRGLRDAVGSGSRAARAVELSTAADGTASRRRRHPRCGRRSSCRPATRRCGSAACLDALAHQDGPRRRRVRGDRRPRRLRRPDAAGRGRAVEADQPALAHPHGRRARPRRGPRPGDAEWTSACARLEEVGADRGPDRDAPMPTRIVAGDWLVRQLEAIEAGAEAIGGEVAARRRRSARRCRPRSSPARGRARRPLRLRRRAAGPAEHAHFSGASLGAHPARLSRGRRHGAGWPRLRTRSSRTAWSRRGIAIHRPRPVRVDDLGPHRRARRARPRPRPRARATGWRARSLRRGATIDAGGLLAAKTQRRSLLILRHAKCATTIGPIIDALVPLRGAGPARPSYSSSTPTPPTAPPRSLAERGAEVVSRGGDSAPSSGPARGKGDAMWRAAREHRRATSSSSSTPTPPTSTGGFVIGLLGPILLEPERRAWSRAPSPALPLGGTAARAREGGSPSWSRGRC